MDKESGSLRQTSLSAGLGLASEHSQVVAYRDVSSGLEYLRRATDLKDHGLSLELGGYQSVVLLHWRELQSTSEQPWDSLCDRLAGRGVSSVDERLTRLRFGPVHDAFRDAIVAGQAAALDSLVVELPDGVESSAVDEALEPTADTAKVASQAISESLEAELATELLDTDKNEIIVPDAMRQFLDISVIFCERLFENLPSELTEAIDSRASSSSELTVIKTARDAVTVSAEDTGANYSQSFSLSLQALAKAALRLPQLKLVLAEPWPSAINQILPGEARKLSSTVTSKSLDVLPGTHDKAWGPILAWLVLRSLPTEGNDAAVFDQLQLRAGLAESLASVGIEGEDAWRFAARIRLLLVQADRPELTIASESFWAEPDVRWLAGVNESEGILYFNKEQFEELLCWLHLPAILEMVATVPVDTTLLEKIEASVVRPRASAEAAGYQLKRYLKHAESQLKDSQTGLAADSSPSTLQSLKTLSLKTEPLASHPYTKA